MPVAVAAARITDGTTRAALANTAQVADGVRDAYAATKDDRPARWLKPRRRSQPRFRYLPPGAQP